MHPAITIFLVFVGCCSNAIFLELLIKEDPGCGHLITFAQFLVIAVEGFVTTMKFGTRKSSVPIQEYVKLVTMFFVVSVINNYALNFNIAMPLHMIFRAGSLLASMILGILILKRRYTAMKYLSVLMISSGIFIFLIVSAKDLKSEAKRNDGDRDISFVREFLWWLIGITLLTVALFMSARMGIIQEVLYLKYGKHPRQALFFTHALPLPGFLLLFNDILHHINITNASAPLSDHLILPGILATVPRMWIYLIGNVLAQSLCINAVFELTTQCSSLTVTLVVTLRKFLSLFFSIWYFQNPFTIYHWVGTLLVFGGTALYSDIPYLLRSKSKIN